MLYDKLTQETAKLVSKLDAINSLIVKNSKAAEKNANLCKYVFVLNQQKDIGKRLLGDVQNIQKEVISRISHKRNSEDFLPDSASNLVDLGAQQNSAAGRDGCSTVCLFGLRIISENGNQNGSVRIRKFC
jgi:hypothetical protein